METETGLIVEDPFVQVIPIVYWPLLIASGRFLVRLTSSGCYSRGYTYAEDYYKGGGYICPSDIFYGRPKRAVNTYGQWKVIVNLPDEYYAKGRGKGYEKYTQTQRLEQCM